MLEVCPSIAAGKPSLRDPSAAIGGKADPVRLVFNAAPGPAVVVGMLDMGDRLRLVVNEVDVVEPEQALPKLPVARALWMPRPDLADGGRGLAARRRRAPHGVHPGARRRAARTTSRRSPGSSCVVIDEDTDVRAFKNELRWNQAYYHLAGGL